MHSALYWQIQSKIGQVTSITFSDMKESEILTTELKDSSYKKYKNIVEVK